MNRNGFSLIEILIAVGISALILAVVSLFQTNVWKYGAAGDESLRNAEDARSIIKTVIRELRSAKPANNGAYPLVQAATSSLTFYSDTDNDGLQEKIRYFFATTTSSLYKGSIKPAENPLTYDSSQEKFFTLAHDIQNGTSTDIFEYYDSSYTGNSAALVQPVNISDVRLVKINLIMDKLYTSQVTLRNLKENI